MGREQRVMSIPLVDFRRGYHPDRLRYELRATVAEAVVFVIILTSVAMYLLAPTLRGKK